MRGRLLRLGVAIGLTAYVLWTSDPRAVWAACRDANWWWIAAAMALVVVDRALMAARWIELLAALTPGSRPPFLVVLRVFFVSSFVSNFVPSLAADSYRMYALSRYRVDLAESAASVLMDRLLGILSVVIVAAGALPFATALGVPDGVLLVLGATVAGCIAAGSVVFSERAARAAVRMSALVPVDALHRMTAALVQAVRRYAQHHTALLRVLLMSIAVQVFRVVQAMCLGYALGLTVPAAAYFAFIPLIVLIMQVPITVNGFGTTQYAFTTLFVPLGAEKGATFALSILFLALGILGSLPGALFYAAGAPARSKADLS
jgi:uncharacterized protein (TIRG00374 family)